MTEEITVKWVIDVFKIVFCDVFIFLDVIETGKTNLLSYAFGLSPYQSIVRDNIKLFTTMHLTLDTKQRWTTYLK